MMWESLWNRRSCFVCSERSGNRRKVRKPRGTPFPISFSVSSVTSCSIYSGGDMDRKTCVALIVALCFVPADLDGQPSSREPRESRPAEPAQGVMTSVELDDECLVTLIQDVRIAAPEAGLLKEIAVREGMTLAAEGFVALVDDTRAKLQ